MAPGTGYLSAQGSANLANYCYSGVDHSILANLFMKHFWNWALEKFIPLWIAPNVLTICGLLCVVVAYTSLLQFCPGTDGVAPAWVYVLIAFCVFLYQTLDNLDGKQARRTGTSSPLGELLDHSVDSLVCIMLAITSGATFQFGPVLTFVSLLLTTTLFYLAHWEAYFTKSLILRPLANPTEVQFALIGLLLFTAYNGSLVWLQVVNVPFVGALELRDIMFFASVRTCLSGIYDYMGVVYRYCRVQAQSFRRCLMFLVPYGLFVVLSGLWAATSPELFHLHSRLFTFSIGLVFSYLAMRAIIQAVAKEPFKL